MIETMTFELADGTSETEFLAADKRVQEEFFPFQPGAARRTTAHGADGWIVITLWHSHADAEAAARAAESDDACREMRGLMAGSSVRVARYETLD